MNMQLTTQSDRAGHLLVQHTAGERFKSFVPKALPPDPPLHYDRELRDLLDKANRGLGRLDVISDLLPDPGLFLHMYVRKEALLSSQIEGAQSTLADLLEYEEQGRTTGNVEDVEEVTHYVKALMEGLNRIRQDDFPISLRLIRDLHRILLSSGRGAAKDPGEFRRSPNWIGGTRPGNAQFVPPPADEVLQCLSDLEKYIHDEKDEAPFLIKAGLVHAQFETIHPFLDGNGRIGRLLITLMLCAADILQQPTLYLSLYFKRHRTEYGNRLTAVRFDGDWEGWIKFYLEAICEVSKQATATARQIAALFQKHQQQIQTLGRGTGSPLRLHGLLMRSPFISASFAAKQLGMTTPTVRMAIQRLVDLGHLEEISRRQRNRVYVYHEYYDILKEGTEEPPG